MTPELRALNPPTVMKPVGYSHAYEARGGRLLFIAGQVARDSAGAVIGKGDLVAQFRRVCENWKAILGAAGGQFTDVVKLTLYVLDVDDYKTHAREIGHVYREYFGKHFPAMTLIGVKDLYDADDGCLIEVEGFAVLP